MSKMIYLRAESILFSNFLSQINFKHHRVTNSTTKKLWQMKTLIKDVNFRDSKKKTNCQHFFCLFLLCHIRVSSESNFWGCLNVKGILARNRRGMWRLSDCNETRTHNHLVHKWTLNHLAKLASLTEGLSVCLQNKQLWVQLLLHPLNLQISHLFRVRSSLTFFRNPRLTLNAYVT